MAPVAIALAPLYMSELYRKAELLCTVVPIAIFANIARVTALLVIAHGYCAETATKFYRMPFTPLHFIYLPAELLYRYRR
jgi:exosortase/archaeosortase family protein